MHPADVSERAAGAGFRPLADSSGFFDWASTSPLARSAVQAMASFRASAADQPCPPEWQRTATAEVTAAVRAEVLRCFSGAAGGDVVLVRSVAEAASLLAAGLSPPAGAELAAGAADHPAAVLPWARLSQERRDLCLRTLPCDPGGVLDLDAAASVIGPRTAVVAVGLMTHLDGVVQPIGELARLVRERSRALLVVDAAQALGRIPVDAAGLGADVLLGTGRKALLGPLGAGFMLLRPGLADRLRPAVLSTRNAVAEPGADGTWPAVVALRGGPVRLEGNLPDLAALRGLQAALCAYSAVGAEAIAAHCRELHGQLADLLPGSGVRLFRAGARSTAGIVRLRIPAAADHRSLAARLRRGGLGVAACRDWVRVSLHLFNSAADVRRLVGALGTAARPARRSDG